MNIEEMVAHLSALTILIDYHSGLGNSTPNRWIVAEFNSVNALLIVALKEKHEDETRQSSSERPSGFQEGTDPEVG